MTTARRGRWFALGAVCGGALVALAVAAWAFFPVVCTTVGYEDSRAIVLDFPGGLPRTAEVGACFALNCTPVPLVPDDDGAYAVPQEPRYLGAGETFPVNTTGVFVSVSDAGATVLENRFGIEAVGDGPSWSRCPGPFHYAPVTVGG